MSHFVYTMNSAGKPPAGGGTTKGWFEYYKWDVDGEAFVPIPEDVSGGGPDVGDTLWFFMDDRVLGCAPVLRVVADELNSQLEVYYDTREMQDFGQQTEYYRPSNTGKCQAAVDVPYYVWLKNIADERYPPRSCAKKM